MIRRLGSSRKTPRESYALSPSTASGRLRGGPTRPATSGRSARSAPALRTGRAGGPPKLVLERPTRAPISRTVRPRSASHTRITARTASCRPVRGRGSRLTQRPPSGPPPSVGAARPGPPGSTRRAASGSGPRAGTSGGAARWHGAGGVRRGARPRWVTRSSRAAPCSPVAKSAVAGSQQPGAVAVSAIRSGPPVAGRGSWR